MSANFLVSASTRTTLIPASQSRPFAARARRGAYAVGHPVGVPGRRKARGIADGRPQEPSRRVAEAADGIPRRGGLAGDAHPEPAVPREVLELDRAKEDGGVEAGMRV